MSPEEHEAFTAWLANKAYIDGQGNYHVKGPHVSGPIAPWNKTIKRRYHTAHALHTAAHQWDESQKDNRCSGS